MRAERKDDLKSKWKGEVMRVRVHNHVDHPIQYCTLLYSLIELDKIHYGFSGSLNYSFSIISLIWESSFASSLVKHHNFAASPSKSNSVVHSRKVSFNACDN
jgi:hypothetical protein